MSTLKTNNIEHIDASTPSVQMSVGGGVVFPGISTFTGNATFSANVSIGGTLTYEDVTSIDSVGIITAQSGIHVTGGDLTLPDAIIHAGDTNTKIRFPAADTITAETTGLERFRITSTGDVNIGPSANANGHGLLTLSQTALSAFNALVIQQGNTQFTATDGLHIGIDAGVHAYIKQFENRDIYFTTGTTNTERLRIASDGKLTAKSTHSNGAVNEALRLTTLGTYSSGNSSNAGPAISFGQFDGDYPTWTTAQVAGIRKGNNWHGALAFYTNSGSSQTDISEKVRITSAGTVGLCTASPSARLHVHAPGSDLSTIRFSAVCCSST